LGFKIKIFTVGKSKEEWLRAGIEEYTKRLSNSVEITWFLAKDDVQLANMVSNEKGFICLDPIGSELTSEQFSEYLFRRLDIQGSRLSFLIGGADGIPHAIKENRDLLSLSKMTFTHQMTRLILLEQIYRAVEIAKGSAYHKG
jgi:23S rRNA (pseudouridine1915-N3)-methyltransferase